MPPRFLSRRASLALAVLPLAGCSTFRPRPDSGIPLPPQLASATAEPANWPDPLWWRGFGSPELDALMERAVLANFDIRAAIARVRQADAQVRIAGQALLPSGNLTGSATRSQSPVQTATAVNLSGSGGRRFVQRELFQTGLQASYEIDFWGKNRAGVVSAEQNARASRFDVAAVAVTTEASVANTYFQILASREQLAIQQANLEAAQRILTLLQQRLAAGTGTGLDIAQQQTLVEQQRAAIPPLRQSIDQNTYSLGTLTGQTPELVARPRMALADIRVPAPRPGLPSEVMQRRPDVWLAEATLAAVQASVEQARTAMFPSITLTASGGFQNIAIENLLRPGSALYSLATGLTQPIFQLGQLRAQYRLTQAQAEEILENYRLAIVAALVDVESAIVALRETTDQEALQASATRSAERAYAISEAQLRAGTIDLLTLLNTQQALFNTRNQLTQVRLLKLQAAVGLFRALGGGWS
ncbi:efflux transporter outer membrane subunit [Roseococcus sp. SYP-B2431]|uniref:efflux transporter outer membrane subunit n=1 Tax=Roseococcus sp. SYP-B2431 TaxID=2496640 RepID=UPI001039D932|nr:efflux transporter outer membrane subunit [Roseococcus sp. SYP-B2431]TCH98204.1 efflux transporter outer membrane subunit [Roseococcus sp. SYP-B2431]